MKKSIKTILAALALATPLALTSCEGTLDDVFGEWDKPSANTNTNPTPAASETYIVYTAAGVSTTETIPSGATEWTGTVTPGEYGAGFYVVSGTATCAGKLTFTGDAKLILMDNATLTVSDGITIWDDTPNDLGGTLNIYAQSTGASMGKLVVNNNTPSSGGDAHAIVIDGLTIHGGQIDANGDTSNSATNGGAAIEAANGGKFVIYDGIVNAVSNKCNAIYTWGSDIEILGGTVNSDGSAGSGSSALSAGTGTVKISHGSVTAIGGGTQAAIAGNTVTIESTITKVDMKHANVTEAAGVLNTYFINATTLNLAGNDITTGWGAATTISAFCTTNSAIMPTTYDVTSKTLTFEP